MNRAQEIEIMKNSLTQSKLTQGMVWTDDRKRMLDRELSVIRLIGGYSPDLEELKEQDLLPDKISARSVHYKPTGIAPVDTYIVENPRKPCYLLPEALGNDGSIHVWSTHGMSIGVLVARAKSPYFDEPGHITRSVLIDEESEVNGKPLSYTILGDQNRPHSITITGDKPDSSFIDIIPGRLGFDRAGHVSEITQIVRDMLPSTGKPDLTLIVKGEKVLTEERKAIVTRGLSDGKTFHTDIYVGTMDFSESSDPLHTYMLKYVFDQGGK
ncbi:hypothetical protein HYU07_03935 [Candidatus Woesearchaeota archaeon]|nr:hypothetical protein [Candidatus Woesearchaeota archaeon]